MSALARPRGKGRTAQPIANRPVTSAVHGELQSLDNLADLLDSRFRLPGTNLRFGLDSIAGLIPGIGDSATALVGAYLVWRAARLGVPRSILVKMAGNIGVDWAVGSVPLLGDVFDLFFKAHRRNIALLRAHVSDQLALDERAIDTSNSGGRAKV